MTMTPPRKRPTSEIYKGSGILYIRYTAEIEEKANVQKKIGGTRPAFSRIEKQPTYKNNDGSYYSLWMGREFRPNQFAILLDFDNKVEA